MAEIEVNSRFFSKVGVHVEDTGGAGRPVVLIHGWPLSKESWSAQVPVFAQAGFRVVSYDRRGFGMSDKPGGGYDYDTLTDDLDGLMSELDLSDATLVGFSMGGGEVARYVAEVGEDRLRSVVFASAVPPYLMHTDDNPDGPLTKAQAAKMTADLTANRDSFFDQFARDFFSVNGDLKVTEAQRQEAIVMCQQSDQKAALACMKSFATTDFRDDLAKVTVPTLVIHGDGDATVPFEGSGARTHKAIPHSDLVVIADAPHGCNVSHADEFNTALVQFLHAGSTKSK
jgi:non-heme chloroperoxidase